MNPCLVSVRAKIERSKHHFNELSDALNVWGAQQADKPILGNLQADGTFSFPKGDDAPYIQWSLIVGDIVHNLRSALDHLVLHLALLHGTKLEVAAELTSFPVALNAPEFRSAIRSFKRCISLDALAALKSCQPYVAAKLRGLPAESHTLYVISKLDNTDKHRTLLFLTEAFQVTDATITDESGFIAKPAIKPNVWIEMKDRAEIGSLDLSLVDFERKDKMQVDVKASTEIFINEPSLGLGAMRLRVGMRQCIELADAIVDQFGKGFFGE
jgi:hypothetical protein